MSGIPYDCSYSCAWEGYKDQIAGIASSVAGADIIEIGAGRAPLFEAADLPQNVASYTLNDISRSELDRAPGPWDKVCFDACGDIAGIDSRYDLAFSKMLAEHVPDSYRFHSNLFQLLRPGGIGFHFMPTLYSPPFVINRLLPETLSRSLLGFFFKQRNDEQVPKFPARYSMCRGTTAGLIQRYKSIGYAEVDIRTFYGHGYFEKLPGLRELDHALSSMACRRGWTLLGSYAYVKLVKPA
jgi:SAM-dependent methyltransferase